MQRGANKLETILPDENLTFLFVELLKNSIQKPKRGNFHDFSLPQAQLFEHLIRKKVEMFSKKWTAGFPKKSDQRY